jgi:hypothetical protein
MFFLISACASHSIEQRDTVDPLSRISALGLGVSRESVRAALGEPDRVTTMFDGEQSYLYKQKVSGGEIQLYSLDFSSNNKLMFKSITLAEPDYVSFSVLKSRLAADSFHALPALWCGSHYRENLHEGIWQDTTKGISISLNKDNQSQVTSIGWFQPSPLEVRSLATDDKCPSHPRSTVESVVEKNRPN